MRRLRKYSSDKKGVSTLIIAIYLVLFAVVLISTLFVSLSIGNQSLKTTYKLEQEQSQERIWIGGPGGMILNGDSVDQLLVKNLGSIIVRIRALYVGSSLICDPSTFEGDAYIEPKHSVWLQLGGNVQLSFEETKLLNWTLRTERGSGSSELGDFILNGPKPPRPDTSNIRMGPFEISFEEFYWKEDQSSTWNPGWSIPDGTKNVIFKISVRNIDDEAIVLTDRSCFVLVNNADIPNDRLYWYIELGSSSNLYIVPGQKTDVLFKWNAPGSKTITNFDKFPPNTSSINYLIFTGYYANPWGSPDPNKPLAQTIPFEAVFTAPK